MYIVKRFTNVKYLKSKKTFFKGKWGRIEAESMVLENIFIIFLLRLEFLG